MGDAGVARFWRLERAFTSLFANGLFTMKTRLCLVLLSLAACAHNGPRTQPSANVMVMGRSGIPEFPGELNRCPTGLGDGNVQKTWSSGKKLFVGKCSSGLMVGTWTAHYENGAVEWTANFNAEFSLASSTRSSRMIRSGRR